MTDLRKAAEQALNALEAMMTEFKALDLPYGSKAYALAKDARLDLRAALAEPVQEPVAWMYPDDYEGILKNQSYTKVFQKEWCNPAVCVPLYTAPPQRKPLTEEEIGAAANSVRWSQQYHVDFTRAIERAHGIGT